MASNNGGEPRETDLSRLATVVVNAATKGDDDMRAYISGLVVIAIVALAVAGVGPSDRWLAVSLIGSASVGLMMFYIVFLAIPRRRRMREADESRRSVALAALLGDPTMDAELHDKAVLTSIRDTIQIERLVASVQDIAGPYKIPVLQPVNMAFNLLSRISESVPQEYHLELMAMHVIPRGRSETYWWTRSDARQYLSLQSKLIASGRLQVRRILSTEDEEQLMADDIAPWLEQVVKNMKLRWAAHNEVQEIAPGCSDFVIIDVVGPANATASRIILIERQEQDRGKFVELWASNRLKETSLIVRDLAGRFNEHWNRLATFEIPDTPWWDREARKPGTSGLLAYSNALRRIRVAKEFVVAVDISDLKGGLDQVNLDPSYRAWFATTNKRIGTLPFRRVYVLQRKRSSVECLIRDHLDGYFEDNGDAKEQCLVQVVFDDELTRFVDRHPISRIQEWLAKHRHLEDHLRNVQGWDDDPRVRWKALLRRDFLATESMVYDYRSQSATFDMRNLPDYLVIGDDLGQQRTAEWRSLVDTLGLCALGRVLGTRAEMERLLLDAVQQAPGK